VRGASWRVKIPTLYHRYNDKHTSQALYVGLRLLAPGNSPAGARLASLGDVRALVWTTTGWTLPANRAICVNEKANYTGAIQLARGYVHAHIFCSRRE
jgi:isoleucyl-tRNA synthetase